MSAIDNLIGTWQADLDRYGEVNPEMAELGPEMMDMMLGGMTVEIGADQLALKNYGGKGRVMEGGFTNSEQEGKLRLEVTMEGSGRKGVFEVEFVDDDHINFSLVEPKNDPMAFKRA